MGTNVQTDKQTDTQHPPGKNYSPRRNLSYAIEISSSFSSLSLCPTKEFAWYSFGMKEIERFRAQFFTKLMSDKNWEGWVWFSIRVLEDYIIDDLFSYVIRGEWMYSRKKPNSSGKSLIHCKIKSSFFSKILWNMLSGFH